MDKIILYNYFRSSTSFRVRIALELKQLAYEYRPIHLLNNGGEQHSPEYRKINAMGGVPTLVHKTSTHTLSIGQSMAILEYLDEAFPQSYQLFPKHPYQKALIKQFCENINADIHPYGNLRTLQYLEKNLHADESAKNQWVQHWISIGLTACETMIQEHLRETTAKGPFCFGDTLTAADVLLIPQIFTAKRFNVSLEKFPTLINIFNHCSLTEAFKKAHPMRQIDTPEELKIKDS
ncbi:MAG: maleylacetoacetate isomerase [Pseudobdellovibrio sp.]